MHVGLAIAFGILGALLLSSRASAAPLRVEPLRGRSRMRGKALFIRNYRSIDSDPARAVSKYISWGYTWAVVPWIWQSRGNVRRVNQSPLFYEALRASGIPFYLMVYPEREGWEDTVRDTVANAKRLGALGVLLDAETPWQRHPEESEALAIFTRRHCRALGLEVGLTSLGSAQVQRNFPYASFAPYMDFAIPQLYDPSLKLSRSYFTTAYQKWRELGFSNLILGLSEYERTTCDDGQHDGSERCERERAETKKPPIMARYLSAAKAVNPVAAIFWTDTGMPDTQAQIRNWRV